MRRNRSLGSCDLGADVNQELPEEPVARLLEVMARLRHPETGCPWDIEQDFQSIAPYTIEEAYEVAGAIADGDLAELEEELGDLLLQVVYHARMAEEQGAFDFRRVARKIADKMIRRHPHVFGDVQIASAGQQTLAWEEQKAAERARKAGGPQTLSALDGVSPAFPALMRAQKLQKRAGRVGFDWPDAAPVWSKIEEELAELKEAVDDAAHQTGDAGKTRLTEEAGDLLFAVVNLCRHLDIDAETALRDASGKFERRFRGVEAGLAAEGKAPATAGLDAMERHWQAIKKAERDG